MAIFRILGSSLIMRAAADANPSSVCPQSDPTCSLPIGDVLSSSSLLQTKSIEGQNSIGSSCQAGTFSVDIGLLDGMKLRPREKPEIDVRCAADKVGQLAPIIIYTGNPPGNMKKWMQLQTGTNVVGVNLNTNRFGQVLDAYEWWMDPANAKQYGGDATQIIMAGYSLGSIQTHEVMEELCGFIGKMAKAQGKKTCPLGIMMFNGVTRGSSYKGKGKKPAPITAENAPAILILQGLADTQFMPAAEKYKAALDKAQIPYTWVGLPKVNHVTLSKAKAEINQNVQEFIARITTSGSSGSAPAVTSKSKAKTAPEESTEEEATEEEEPATDAPVSGGSNFDCKKESWGCKDSDKIKCCDGFSCQDGKCQASLDGSDGSWDCKQENWGCQASHKIKCCAGLSCNGGKCKK